MRMACASDVASPAASARRTAALIAIETILKRLVPEIKCLLTPVRRAM
jgi:hypothetical protein